MRGKRWVVVVFRWSARQTGFNVLYSVLWQPPGETLVGWVFVAIYLLAVFTAPFALSVAVDDPTWE